MSRISSALVVAALASAALARTDLVGCTSTDVSSPAGASIAWYVPGTGELCDFLDCGGGTAPPKTTVPGCPLYSGTATYSPSYLSGYGSMTASSSSIPTETSISSTQSATIFDLSYTSTITSSAAWSSTSDLNSSLENSAVIISTTSSSWLSSMSTITSSAVVVPGNGILASSTASTDRNVTVASVSPSSTISQNSGAVETARVWIGGVGLVGLGAVVAAL